jgi:GNAT superfamily N-acetyltransferase
MEIRAAEPGDVDGALALHDANEPYLAVTRASLVRRASMPPVPGLATLAAVDGGEVVGWATTALISGSVPLSGQLRILVRPDHRGRGIGTQLLEATHQNLRAGGATSVRVFAEPGVVEWAARWGYRQTRQVHYVGIDPQKAADVPEAPTGVELRLFTDVDPRVVYEADEVAQRTKPGDANITTQPYDEWLTDMWNATSPTVHDLSVVAMYRGELVAFTLSQGDHTRIWSKMTSTMPEYRGRGLAKLVKAAALHRAAEVGVRGAYTANYDGNAPMIAVNEWLGYDLVATHAVIVCPL